MSKHYWSPVMLAGLAILSAFADPNDWISKINLTPCDCPELDKFGVNQLPGKNCTYYDEPCLCLVDEGPPEIEEPPLELFDLLKNGSEYLKNYTHETNAVLMLGNTGAGKTTTAYIIAGDMSRLHSVVDLGENFVIVDEDNKIGVPSTKSKTLFPELIKKHENGSTLSFYDFPGFDDTRGAVEDIAANFLINGIVQKIDHIKMLFLATYADITLQNRDGFNKLANHATTFVKDIAKFNGSYGLLVTKVAAYNGAGKPISDSTLMSNTVGFLQKYRTDLQENLESGNEEEKQKALKKITFVDSLLLKDEDGYKIWFVRSPEQCGPLSESKRMMDARSNITNLYERLDYKSIDEDMFGFTVSAETSNKIQNEYVPAVNNAIKNAITLVTKEMCDWYKDDILHTRLTLAKLNQKLEVDQKAIDHLSNSYISNPVPAYNALKLFWYKAGFQMSKDLEEFLKQQQLFLDFFDKVSGRTHERPVTEWMRQMTDINSYIHDHKEWYEFCKDLESALYSYEVQSKPIPPPANNDWLDHIERNRITTVSDRIKGISERIEKQELQMIGEMLTFTLRPPSVTCDFTTNKLTIKGNVMALKKMMSNITESLRNCNGATQIDFYAAHTIFLDDGIVDQNNASNIVIIAPNLDSPMPWTLMLRGIDGQKRSPEMAENGTDGGSTTNIHGTHGCAGFPGGSAYSAFIIADHITSTSELLVNTKGGKGGPGQHGGNGGKGARERNAISHRENCGSMDAPNYCFEVTDRVNCTHYGFTSQDAGNGGDGGQKGAGGFTGVNTVVQFVGNTTVTQVNGTGPLGDEGRMGIGGEALRGGMGYTCHGSNCIQKDPSNGQRYGRHGSNGRTGGSTNCLQTPVRQATLLEWLSLVQYQAAFVNDNNQELMQISHNIAFNVKTANYFTLKVLGEESLLLLNLNPNNVNIQRRRSLLLLLVQRFENYFTKHYQGATNEQKKIMTMFLTSSFSAMGRLRMPTALSLIVDGESHLEDIEQNIYSLKSSGDRNSLHQFVKLEKDSWREILSQKFLHATEFANRTVASTLVKAGESLKYEANQLGEQLDSILEDDALSMEEAIRIITEWEEKMRIHWSLEVYSVVFYFTKDDLPFKNLFDLVVADLYAKYHGQIDKLEMLMNLSNRLENMSTEVEQKKRNFEKDFLPLIDSLLDHYTNINVSLANGGDINPPAIELSKWEVLQQLRECKHYLQTFLDEMVVFEPVVDAFNRIQDALTFSMELYEISHDYMEIQTLAKYFGIVQSTSLVNVPITDPDFKHTLAEFDRHVRESRIDEQVVSAVSGFKQWVFPYANYYLQSLKEGKPLERLYQLQLRIKDYKQGKVGQGDNSLKLAKFDYDSTLTSKPFFTWENHKFSSEIKSLLAGEPVEFLADVTKQGHIGWEAIKCKLTEIKFIINAENNTEKMQFELDHLLENFGVSLTHSGISHFRFQKDHFVMSSDSQTLKYNFEKDSAGNRLGTNDVYESFKKGDIQLSPFTVWTLQLQLTSGKVGLQNGASFDDLQNFASHVDIHLVGDGTYVDGNEALANGDLELLKHYERDVRRFTDFEF